jgi:hypothetical protein
MKTCPLLLSTTEEETEGEEEDEGLFKGEERDSTCHA